MKAWEVLDTCRRAMDTVRQSIKSVPARQGGGGGGAVEPVLFRGWMIGNLVGEAPLSARLTRMMQGPKERNKKQQSQTVQFQIPIQTIPQTTTRPERDIAQDSYGTQKPEVSTREQPSVFLLRFACRIIASSRAVRGERMDASGNNRSNWIRKCWELAMLLNAGSWNFQFLVLGSSCLPPSAVSQSVSQETGPAVFLAGLEISSSGRAE